MFITALHVSIIFFSLFLTTFGLSFLMFKMTVVNAENLGSKITTLIKGNNIDRAIKLLNNVRGPLAASMKHLIRYTHRLHMLELVYHEARIKLLSNSQRHSAWYFPMGFSFLIVIVTFLKTVGPTEDAGWTLFFGASGIGLWVLTNFCVILIKTHQRMGVRELTQLRNVLYQQAQYVPRHFLPVPEADLSTERVAEWRDSLDVFNSDMLDREIQGEEVYVKYELEADDEGILPPLGE